MAAKPELGSKQGQNATLKWLYANVKKIKKHWLGA